MVYGKVNDQNYYLSIVAIFQNEAFYLREWMEFHLLQGVEHFFLYNNRSSDSYKEVLNPYIQKGIVTLLEWPYSYWRAGQNEKVQWLQVQAGAYTHCVKHFGMETKWLAVIDIDEFLFCPSGEKLPTFLNDYERYGGLCVNWMFFGTSGRETIPEDMLMIEALTYRAEQSEPRNFSAKSIVQPQKVLKALNAHLFLYKKGHSAVDVNKRNIKSLPPKNISHDRIRINHYWTRDETYFRERKIASRSGRRVEETEELLRAWAKKYNAVRDDAILQFTSELRKRLGLDLVIDDRINAE